MRKPRLVAAFDLLLPECPVCKVDHDFAPNIEEIAFDLSMASGRSYMSEIS
jgi:hypothetical protein